MTDVPMPTAFVRSLGLGCDLPLSGFRVCLLLTARYGFGREFERDDVWMRGTLGVPQRTVDEGFEALVRNGFVVVEGKRCAMNPFVGADAHGRIVPTAGAADIHPDPSLVERAYAAGFDETMVQILAVVPTADDLERGSTVH